MVDLKTLQNDCWQVGILPETGGSVAFGRVRADGWHDFMRPTPPANYANAGLCASFVLVPYSNRIRDGRFTFGGEPYQLRNLKDGNAIHGIGRGLPWKVEAADGTHVRLRFDSADHVDPDWPFRFSSIQEYRLEGSTFSIFITLTNEDKRAWPGGFGHHPYYQKVVGGSGVSLVIPCDRYVPLDKGLPITGETAPVPAYADFRALRPLGDAVVDDLLTGRKASEPVRFEYEGLPEIRLRADAIFEHFILYAPPGKDFYAIEPVTNLNDGFNLHAKGMPHTGVFVLEPGETRSGLISFELGK
jgi:aldose 1-epimerase